MHFKNIFLVCLLFILSSANIKIAAQVKLCISITALPKNTDIKKLYIVGNFNNWQPADKAFNVALLSNGTTNNFCLNLPKGNKEFKFTLGSWNSVEQTINGNDIPNRKILLQNDTTININIEAFKVENTKPTIVGKLATLNIKDCLDSANRNIYVWTPSNFPKPNTKYSVLYMLDGQNLFDQSIAPYGEWGVDEAIDSIKNLNIIVVGINHANNNRIKEYLPYPNNEFKNNYGTTFIQWVSTKVKKTIDAKYKKYIYTDAAHTFIAGSSMGGLISFYAIANYKNTFGQAGIFSPAFWLGMPNNGTGNCNSSENELCTDLQKVISQKTNLFFMAGLKEDYRIVEPYQKVLNKLLITNSVTHIEDATGEHNEPTWRKHFPAFLQYLKLSIHD